jgi:hypothetical protein
MYHRKRSFFLPERSDVTPRSKRGRGEDEIFSSEKVGSSECETYEMSRKFVLMNLLRKFTGQGRHDAEEYVLPTVPVPFPGVNFGMCFEHKMLPARSTESRVEKNRQGWQSVLLLRVTQKEKQR